jgi:glycosyltransferase involved in cell wall biosynthesis
VRVALVTNNLLPPREGIGRHLVELARRLPAHGIEPLLIGRAPPATPPGPIELDGIPVRLVAWSGPPPLCHARARRVLERWLARGGEGVELLHVHLPLVPPLRTRLPVVVTVHSPMLADSAAIPERGLEPFALKAYAKLFSSLCEQRWLDRADRVITVSTGVRDELAALYRLRGRTPLVLTNGVDADFFAATPPVPREREVLFVGRLSWRKGLHRLLEAFARLPEGLARRLVLVGEGPLKRELLVRARGLGIADRLELAGFLDREGVRARLARAAVAVNPADYESGPLTLLEAMAAGTPVVSTRTGLVAEFGADPPLLVVERTPEALAAGLEAALADPEAAAARARRAQALVRARFDWGRIAAELAAVYRERAERAA